MKSMRTGRFSRLLTTWMAVLAILAAALAPAISHALAAENGTAWVEVCSTAGAKWVQAGDDSSLPDEAPGAAHPFEHCPCCAMHADLAVVPAAPTVAQPTPALPQLVPPAFLAAPRTLHAWRIAQSRAPPRLS